MLAPEQQIELQIQLQQAVVACNERCLYSAAKWTAELLNSFPRHNDNNDANESSDTEIDEDDIQPPSQTTTSNPDKREASREAKEYHRYLLAKSFFDCREFDRCAAVFLPNSNTVGTSTHDFSATKLQPGSGVTQYGLSSAVRPGAKVQRAVAPPPLPGNLSQKALFLALYARYMAGEKRKNEESETILGPTDGPSTANKEIPGLLTILAEYVSMHEGSNGLDRSQGWLEYLYGILLIRSNSEQDARQWLLRSVTINSYNWSAWLELASLITSREDLQAISASLPRNIMTFFFHIHCSQELFQQDPETYKTLTAMQSIFPHSAFLTHQHALLLYHARDNDAAMSLFDTLIRTDPHRLEGLEVYSNLLYILPNRAKLATLATLASSTDKFRPETNAILGNYYSLLGEHEKAVLHFRRALTLDRAFAAAWTLMGHEYVELKNTQAAIESYRRAVDVNRKDYRAWYGLGQGYEMLECHSHSLFYYQRAAALCPGDPKMWAAVGNAFAKCGKERLAVQALKRALVVGSQMGEGSSFGSVEGRDVLGYAVGGALDPQVLFEIAVLLERMGKVNEAAAYMELTLAQEEGVEEGDEGLGVTHVTSKARLWLARWAYREGNWERVTQLANELCQDGVEVEEAKSLVKDVRARMSMPEDMTEMDEERTNDWSGVT